MVHPVRIVTAPASSPAPLRIWSSRLDVTNLSGCTTKPEQFSPQHHCVTVSFKGSGLDVDVVPVLYEGGADDRGYLITKDTGDRVLTSIPLHLRFTRTRKAAHKRHYRQMVRLVTQCRWLWPGRMHRPPQWGSGKDVE
jgi:hypothetical protein